MLRARAGDTIFAIAALVIGFCASQFYFGTAIKATIADRIRPGMTFDDVMAILDAPSSNVTATTWDQVRACFNRQGIGNARRLHSLVWDGGAEATTVFFDDHGRVLVAVSQQRTISERLQRFWTDSFSSLPPF